MKMVAASTLEPNLWRRRRAFLLIASAVLATSQVLTIQTGRAFANHTTTWSVAIDAVLVLLTTGALALAGNLFLRAPLRQAWVTSLRNERRYRTLAQDSADLIGIITRSRFDAVDDTAVAALLGYTAGDVSTFTLSHFIHPEDRRVAAVCWLSLSSEQPRASLTVRLKHKSGHIVWADICLRRVEVEGEAETIVTIRDVTRRQREAAELREATATAQRARAEADQASQAKTEFLACMSHEIRSPLNSVIGFAGLLLQRDDLAPQARLYGERISAAGKALLTVVDDILDFSRVEAGALELTLAPFSLPHLIDECLSIVHQEATVKQLPLHLNLMERLPAAVLGDAARLRQVLLNLLYNAIKFTNQGSVLLDIRLGRGAGARDTIKFSITDTGIGIAREDLPRLFQRFEQIDGSIGRTYGGTGLGLAISKRLVELMGGQIGVESEQNVGSTFWFALPLPAQQMLPASTKADAPDPGRACHILLVEDVPMNQDLVRHILEARNHTVDVVGNGAEAIMAVLDMEYDVVLMDIQMPHLDGLSTTRMIRDLPHRCRNVPIVAITANALPEQTEEALAAGMNEVIHKPLSADRIYAVIGHIVGEPATASPKVDQDRALLGKLADLIGDAKTKQLLASLADSLASRFDGDPRTPEGRALLKRQAHASVAGSGMLGFTRFAADAKAFEVAPEDATFAARTETLKRAANKVAAMARRLAGSPRPLSAMMAA